MVREYLSRSLGQKVVYLDKRRGSQTNRDTRLG